MTKAGIEPATFRFVAQHLNHCATAAPYHSQYLVKRACASQEGVWATGVMAHSALTVGEWSASRPDHLTFKKGTYVTRWIGVWLHSTADLNIVGKRNISCSLWIEPRFFGRAALRCASSQIVPAWSIIVFRVLLEREGVGLHQATVTQLIYCNMPSLHNI